MNKINHCNQQNKHPQSVRMCTYVVFCCTDDWLRFVAEVWSLTPEYRN